MLRLWLTFLFLWVRQEALPTRGTTPNPSLDIIRHRIVCASWGVASTTLVRAQVHLRCSQLLTRRALSEMMQMIRSAIRQMSESV